jgi:hypothetical protein
MNAPQLRARCDKADTYPDNCITEGDTPHGYWWRYRHPRGQPAVEIETAICVAFQIADAEARKTGKTYLVASTQKPPAVYVFACDHPHARKAAITIMVEQTPAGERIRRPGIRSATRH